MHEILKTHKVFPIPDDQEKEVEKILNKAREYYIKKDEG